ncbi:MAG: 50S ribosomal protein L3 N(5)-glutamine methyltransferase [Gammaproteobacteria bacterium]|nr:MAG: 50S ribosomal protein L3 N(5)-glutamine methyltransferase [Gammaproteobacteria bacterium]
MNSENNNTTISECILTARQKLEAADVSYGQGSENAEQEASWLIMHALGIEDNDIDSELGQPVSREGQNKIQALLHRRIHGHIPAAYLTNEMWFAQLHFYVDERVLIPRSHMAEFIQDSFEPWLASNKIKNVLDLCTGSGCIAIAMAIYYENVEVDASDISADALKVAQRNIDTYDFKPLPDGKKPVAEYKLNQRIHLIQSDLFKNIPEKKYDLILSNPPYVDAATMNNLPEEFKKEPALGLASGDDGLDAVREILGNAAEYLKPHGILICEVGDSAGTLMQAFPDIPFLWLETYSGEQSVFLLTQRQLQKI